MSQMIEILDTNTQQKVLNAIQIDNNMSICSLYLFIKNEVAFIRTNRIPNIRYNDEDLYYNSKILQYDNYELLLLYAIIEALSTLGKKKEVINQLCKITKKEIKNFDKCYGIVKLGVSGFGYNLNDYSTTLNVTKNINFKIFIESFSDLKKVLQCNTNQCLHFDIRVDSLFNFLKHINEKIEVKCFNISIIEWLLSWFECEHINTQWINIFKYMIKNLYPSTLNKYYFKLLTNVWQTLDDDKQIFCYILLLLHFYQIKQFFICYKETILYDEMLLNAFFKSLSKHQIRKLLSLMPFDKQVTITKGYIV